MGTSSTSGLDHPRLAQMEKHLAELRGQVPTLLKKLDTIHELLASQRKDNYVVEEIAKLTGRSEYTIRRWVTEGKLKAVRIAEGGPRGRLLIPREELERLIAAGKGSEIPVTSLVKDAAT